VSRQGLPEEPDSGDNPMTCINSNSSIVMYSLVINRALLVPTEEESTKTSEAEMKHRTRDRRSYSKIPDFPFLTHDGVVRRERRQLVDRRIRDMQAGWFKA
jgi:hypothetical protein